jgi:hypothetical protein
VVVLVVAVIGLVSSAFEVAAVNKIAVIAEEVSSSRWQRISGIRQM